MGHGALGIGETRGQGARGQGDKLSLGPPVPGSPGLPVFPMPHAPCPMPHTLLKMQVEFREFNPFDVWFWLEFSTVPSEGEKQYIEEVFSSWFLLGKLGGFNAENLQVQETGIEIGYMDYDRSIAEGSMMALMHNMGEFDYLGQWGRCWFDLGTSDAIALDVLINSLLQLSQEYVALERLIVGGQNEDWPVEDSDSYSTFMYEN